MNYMGLGGLFVEIFAFVHSIMQNGMTPLHLAVWYSLQSEDCETVKTLLEYNADCSATDEVISFQSFLAVFCVLQYTTLLICFLNAGGYDSTKPSVTKLM